MNLYFCWRKWVDYGLYAFAETPGKARSYCTEYHADDEDFIGWNPILLEKGLADEKYKPGAVDIDSDNYELVKELGYEFGEEEE